MRPKSMSFKALSATLLLAWAAGARVLTAAEARLLTEETPWRVFLTLAPPLYGTAGNYEPRRNDLKYGPTALPPDDWHQPQFDDGVWGRYAADLFEAVGGYGYWQSPWSALLCLRTRFGVSDAEAVDDLRLEVSYRGGAIVYVNGQEVGRGHLPAGKVEPLELAADYPAEAFFAPGGEQPLPRASRPAEEYRDRYERRIRRLAVAVPRKTLRKGSNVLAIELHRTATRRGEWSTVGLCEVELASRSTAGVIPYEEAAGGLQLFNASPLATISRTADGKMPYRATWNVGPLAVSPAGIKRGNPFDPLRPVRTVAARGGVCSGQVVLSSSTGLRNVRAEIGRLKHASGATIPPEAVTIRYARQSEEARYCDAFVPEPAGHAAVQPVWVIVDVPARQQPGWYTGELKVAAEGKTFDVSVQVLVSAWKLPDPKDYLSFASLLQSPDSVALHYEVEPLSPRHFALLEKSLELMGQVGNDVLFVPVVHHTHMGHHTGLVRWIKQDGGCRPEFEAFEKYLDLYVKHCGAPKVICLIVWKPQFGNQSRFRGAQVKTIEPIFVTELDPATGRMTELEAPMFGREGSDAFWKPMIDGVRRIVRQRGWDERRVMIGQGFDSRPLKPTVDFFRNIAPGVRWTVFSHWVRDAGPLDGRLVVNDGMEVGYREEVAGGLLPELRPGYPNLPKQDFLTAGAHRIQILTWSSPTAYRNVSNMTGTFCRIGLDFWPVVREGDRLRSLFNTRICGSWLYKSNPREIVAPGPEGAVGGVRFQMLREGVQETEARIFIAKSLPGLPAEKQDRYRRLLSERAEARRVAKALTQAQISLDWLGLTARAYAAAAELAGLKSDGRWDAPPR